MLKFRQQHSDSLQCITRRKEGKKEGRNVVFNEALNTFYSDSLQCITRRKERRKVLFNDALNTFYSLITVHNKKEGRKEGFI